MKYIVSALYVRESVPSTSVLGVLKQMIFTEPRVSRMTIRLKKNVLQKNYLNANLVEIMRFLLVKAITFFNYLNVCDMFIKPESVRVTIGICS